MPFFNLISFIYFFPPRVHDLKTGDKRMIARIFRVCFLKTGKESLTGDVHLFTHFGHKRQQPKVLKMEVKVRFAVPLTCILSDALQGATPRAARTKLNS